MLEDKPGMNPADLTGKLLYKQLVSGKPNFAGLQVLHPCLPGLDIRLCSALPCRRAVVCVRPWSWPIDAFGGSQGRVVVDGFGVREGHFCLKSIVGRQYVKVRPLRYIVTFALRFLCHCVFRLYACAQTVLMDTYTKELTFFANEVPRCLHGGKAPFP